MMRHSRRTKRHDRRQRSHEEGFSLLELLICITIMAITVFPLLLVKEQSFSDATDAKMSRIVRNHIQRLLSEVAVDLDDGETRSGDLADYDYENVYWRVECTAIDLSTEVADQSERSTHDDDHRDWSNRDDSLFDEMDNGDEEDDDLFDDEDEDDIEPRFRYRHIRLTISYPVGFGDEAELKEIMTETYLQPLPDEEDVFDEDFGRSDSVPPNNGDN